MFFFFIFALHLLLLLLFIFLFCINAVLCIYFVLSLLKLFSFLHVQVYNLYLSLDCVYEIPLVLKAFLFLRQSTGADLLLNTESLMKNRFYKKCRIICVTLFFLFLSPFLFILGRSSSYFFTIFRWYFPSMIT